MPVNDGGQPRNFSLEAASRQYNQSFAENAYGGDSDDEDEDEDEDEMEVDVTPDAPPSKAIKAFYMSATEAVRDLLGSGDIEQSKKEIRDMNLVIESQNELCSERKDAHKIQVDAFAVYRTAKDTYSANSTTANREKLDKAYESLGSCITRWGYPPIWLDYFMKRSEGKNPIRNDSGIPQPGGSTSRGARTGKNTSGSSHNGGHTNVSDLPETSQPGSSSASGGNMDLDPPNPLHHPEHGKCIGCLPKVGRDKFGNKVQLDCDFMFEDPFLVLSCHQVTHTWAQNYDFLPKDKQIDLRDAGWALAKEPSQIKEDKGKPIFRGWYSKQSSESKRGAGWAKILLKDNSIAVINRSNLRKIYGQSWADQWIDEYLASKSLRGDWHHLRENRAPHRLEYHPQQHLLPWNTIREHQSEFSGSDSGSDTAPQASRTRHDIALAPSGVRSTRARTLKSASTAIDTGRKNDEAALVPRAVYNTNVKALNRRMDNVESQLEELIHRMKRF
ncbi:hypothetical protein SLS60_011931 [Paraconiothyrium brasiliense]|uniref:Uncharacterized protein n=1 Tax=Paraconiothyrium brasiliense TaxID=300254 RepID=A0ABR3QI18_9PLEO